MGQKANSHLPWVMEKGHWKNSECWKTTTCGAGPSVHRVLANPQCHCRCLLSKDLHSEGAATCRQTTSVTGGALSFQSSPSLVKHHRFLARPTVRIVGPVSSPAKRSSPLPPLAAFGSGQGTGSAGSLVTTPRDLPQRRSTKSFLAGTARRSATGGILPCQPVSLGLETQRTLSYPECPVMSRN